MVEVHYRLPSGINAVVRDTSIVKSLRLEVVDAMRRLETVEEKFDKRIEGAQALGSQGACVRLPFSSRGKPYPLRG